MSEEAIYLLKTFLSPLLYMCAKTWRLTRGGCSFFGTQEGDFSIDIHAIAAVSEAADGEDDDEFEDDPKAAVAEAAAARNSQSRRSGWMRRLLCGLI